MNPRGMIEKGLFANWCCVAIQDVLEVERWPKIFLTMICC